MSWDDDEDFGMSEEDLLYREMNPEDPWYMGPEDEFDNECSQDEREYRARTSLPPYVPTGPFPGRAQRRQQRKDSDMAGRLLGFFAILTAVCVIILISLWLFT